MTIFGEGGQKILRRTPKRIMDAAEGEECTFHIAGVCNYDSTTTVGCHLPDGSGGSNKLTGALSVAFGCSNCHAVLDGRVAFDLPDEDREFYMRRGMMRTINRLIEIGLVQI